MAAKRPPQKDIDALFQLPLSEFTSGRDALATRLKQAGQTQAAEQVKALAKPSLSAWVVNQLYWRDRREFDELVAASAAIRAAHGTGGNPRPALDARRDALAKLSRRATERLHEAGGGKPTPEMMRRISATLEALTTYAPSADTAPGRLTRDLDPPGFEALAGLLPAAAGRRSAKTSRVLAFPQPARPEAAPKKPKADAQAARRQAEERRAAQLAARRAVEEAEEALRAARRAAEQTTRALAAAQERAEAAKQRQEELAQRLAEASEAARSRAQEARKLERDAAAANAAVTEAERRLARAREKLAE